MNQVTLGNVGKLRFSLNAGFIFFAGDPVLSVLVALVEILYPCSIPALGLAPRNIGLKVPMLATLPSLNGKCISKSANWSKPVIHMVPLLPHAMDWTSVPFVRA